MEGYLFSKDTKIQPSVWSEAYKAKQNKYRDRDMGSHDCTSGGSKPETGLQGNWYERKNSTAKEITRHGTTLDKHESLCSKEIEYSQTWL